MRNHTVSASHWIRGAAAGAAIVLIAIPVTGQQTRAAGPSPVVDERSGAQPPEELGTDVTTLRRQARELQRALSAREKELAGVQQTLQKDRQDLIEVAEYAKKLKAQLAGVQDREKAAVAQARRHEKALQQAMQEAEKTRQNLEAMEEQLKAQQALAAEAELEVAALKELLSYQADAPNPPGDASGGTASSLLIEGHQLLADGQVEEAADLFRQGAARYPEDLAYPIGLASCHYAAGKLPLASAQLDKVLEEDDDQAEAHGLLGLIRWQEGDLRQAERSLARAVREQPDNGRWLVYLGMVQYARGRHSAAREAFEDAIKINPMNPEAQFNLAILLAGSDRPDLVRARVHYEQARRLGSEPDPGLEEVLYTR